MNKSNLVLTTGDPAGCGALITLEAIRAYRNKKVNFFVVGDQKIVQKIPAYSKIKNRINLINLNTLGIEKIKPGFPSALSGKVSLSYLKTALQFMKVNKIKGLVTAPLSKEAVQIKLPSFSGYTEYLADYFKVKNPVMMMVSQSLKTVLLTRHIALRDVSSSLNKKNMLSTLSLVHKALTRQFKIKKPKIVFSSLNPHAGINTFLGQEERKILEVIRKFKPIVFGPFAADSLFTKNNLKKYDCVICSYHDQAMIPFKLLAMVDGVNLTIGLPIIRTSPAHGVAYDLILKRKKPFSSSMLAAIELALKLSR